MSEACFHGKDVVKTIRNQDRNALSIGVNTPHISFADEMGKPNQVGFDRFKDGSKYEHLYLIALKLENQPGLSQVPRT